MLNSRTPEPIIQVIRPGVLTSIQDMGRAGYQSLGIAEAGAMDTLSLVAANRLVDNPDCAAALEMTVVGPRLRFLDSAIFSLTGADLSARLDEGPLSPGKRYTAAPDQILSFGKRENGMYAYLGIMGGFNAPLVLGSRSTYLYAGFGGLNGRALLAGDVLWRFKRETTGMPSPGAFPAAFLLSRDGLRHVRVILGPNEERFTHKGMETFFDSEYEVTTASNRMGYRLNGPKIEHTEGPIIVSESTPAGAIQVPGQGTPVVLLRERGTTGGYTKIACTITADIDLIAQAAPGGKVRFGAVSLTEAHEIDRSRWAALDAWKKPVPEPAPEQAVTKEA
jgi:antagonist of KipI